MEEPSILHSAVWLIQLLVSVAHIFVPEARLLLRRDIEQRPHLLLYRICREADDFTSQRRTLFSPSRALTWGSSPHRLCLLY